tara:strand:+ start:312 stop:1301 length:990 start_codon:yes stop_codon:yes gene_type:complete
MRVGQGTGEDSKSSMQQLLSFVKPERVPPGTKFVDLFCGLGGASTGARAAGLDVDLAADFDAEMLALHALNHPECDHVCTTFPDNSLCFPSAAEPWWLHGSPPCTKVSRSNQQRDAGQREGAVDLVDWYLRLALSCGSTWWTMEQVATPPVVAALDALRLRHSQRVDYEILDFKCLGVPQRRRRLVAGTPSVIAALRRAPRVARSVRDCVPVPRGTHVRNAVKRGYSKQTKAPKRRANSQRKLKVYNYGPDDCCLPVQGPSFCITAHRKVAWATPGTGAPLQYMTPREMAQIQTFPDDYLLGSSAARAQIGIGNAVPPLVMRTIVKQAS